MSAFEDELEATGELLKNAKISKDQARGYVRSLAWFREDSARVEAARWSVSELYRMGTPAFPYSEWGPGWLTLWNNEKCQPRLGGRGDVVFVLHEAGGDVVQTCWREKNFLS